MSFPMQVSPFAPRANVSVGYGWPPAWPANPLPAQGAPYALPAAIQADWNRVTALPRQSLKEGKSFLDRVQWAIGTFLTQVKMGLFLLVGLLAFLPMPDALRRPIERAAVFPPLKVSDVPFLQSEKLRQRIRPHIFDMMLPVQAETARLAAYGLQYDPAQDHIRLRSWHIPARPGMPTVLFNQQRTSNISCLGRIMELLSDQGFGMLVYDYPGYGKSEGKPSEAANLKAGMAASRYLERFLGVPPAQQVIMGYSLGGPAACREARILADEGRPAEALVLVNVFPSIPEAIVSLRRKASQLPLLRRLPWERIFNERRVNLQLNSRVALQGLKNTPTLFIQGSRDHVAPLALAIDMARRMDPSNVPRVETLPGVMHRFRERDYDLLTDHFTRYMRALSGLSPASPG